MHSPEFALLVLWYFKFISAEGPLILSSDITIRLAVASLCYLYMLPIYLKRYFKISNGLLIKAIDEFHQVLHRCTQHCGEPWKHEVWVAMPSSKLTEPVWAAPTRVHGETYLFWNMSPMVTRLVNMTGHVTKEKKHSCVLETSYAGSILLSDTESFHDKPLKIEGE